MDNERASSAPPKLWMYSNICGRGAFITAVKVYRKVCWSVMKSKCRHE